MTYLTTDEVAAQTKYAPYTIRKKAAQYEREKKLRRRNPRGIEGFKQSGEWRFTPQAVTRFIEGK